MEHTKPWGFYKVLHDTTYTKVKLLNVKPGMRLSLQSHKKRNEYWIVVKGIATINLNGDLKNYKYNECVFIDKKTKHRLENNTSEDVQIIEVQCGSYFGEDDIIRYEDDFNRL